MTDSSSTDSSRLAPSPPPPAPVAAVTAGTAAGTSAGNTAGTTAGAILRRARLAQGLHIAALAASIKVTPKKLEALESDQFDQLPDATFTRALAQTVCRSLKIDPAPVLALLPPPNGHRLEEVAEGLKTPFTERPGRLVPGAWLKLSGATLWMAALLVAGAFALYVMPAGWISAAAPHAASSPEVASTVPEPVPPGAEPEPAAAASGATGATAVLAPGAAAPSRQADATPAIAAGQPASAATATGTAPGTLRFETTEAAWIGVTDAKGKSLIGRLVPPGEAVDIDGAMPLQLRVGNANRVRLSFRGQPMDLAKYTRDNVARLKLD